MEEVREEEFLKKDKFKINNILEGFNNYSNGIIEGNNYNDINEFLKECIKLNKEYIVDYYGNTLEEKYFLNILNELDKEEIILIKKIKDEFKNKTIYFKDLEEKEIELINKLSIEGILFSTYYLLSDKVLIWSNYDKKFPVFFRDNAVIEKYKQKCKKYNLCLKNINKK